jgi:hypothetical protein
MLGSAWVAEKGELISSLACFAENAYFTMPEKNFKTNENKSFDRLARLLIALCAMPNRNTLLRTNSLRGIEIGQIPL